MNAKYIILHAGTGSEKIAKNILSEIRDKRIVIENMSFLGIHNERCLGYDAESIVSLGNFGVCLDFGHAIKASVSFKKNYTLSFKICSPCLSLTTGRFAE